MATVRRECMPKAVRGEGNESLSDGISKLNSQPGVAFVAALCCDCGERVVKDKFGRRDDVAFEDEPAFSGL